MVIEIQLAYRVYETWHRDVILGAGAQFWYINLNKSHRC